MDYVDYIIIALGVVGTGLSAYKAGGWLQVIRELIRIIETTDSGKQLKSEIANKLTTKSAQKLDTVIKSEGLLGKSKATDASVSVTTKAALLVGSLFLVQGCYTVVPDTFIETCDEVANQTVGPDFENYVREDQKLDETQKDIRYTRLQAFRLSVSAVKGEEE